MYDLTMFHASMVSAKARGKAHWAKAMGMGQMKFAATEKRAIELATRSARELARRAGMKGQLPQILSGVL